MHYICSVSKNNPMTRTSTPQITYPLYFIPVNISLSIPNVIWVQSSWSDQFYDLDLLSCKLFFRCLTKVIHLFLFEIEDLKFVLNNFRPKLSSDLIQPPFYDDPNRWNEIFEEPFWFWTTIKWGGFVPFGLSTAFNLLKWLLYSNFYNLIL